MSEARNDDPQALELELLAVRCQLGEREAFDELVARWHEPLWRYVLAMTGDPDVAEDVLQEGWLRVLRGIDGLRQPARLRSWVFTIVRRTFLDRLRVRYAEPDLEPLDGPLPDDGPELLDPAEANALDEALTTLSPPDRETIVLFYLQGLDLREVAEVLDIPVGTVKSRLHRARGLLRDRLEDQGVRR